MDLFLKLEDLMRQLDNSVKSVRVTGAEFAQADMNYKIALSEEILRLEASGRPVTNLLYIARGEKKVAKLKYEQIAKEAVYKANLEAINNLKLQIKVINEQLGREWTNE